MSSAGEAEKGVVAVMTGSDIRLLVKSMLDYSGALAGLVLSAPLFVIIAILVKLDSKGPIFFLQERCGHNGKKFKMWKFRTMVENAEGMLPSLLDRNEVDGPAFKLSRDPRTTPFGRFLRKWSFDELPQLINILKGEMSIVGPRPAIPDEVGRYEPWQLRRLSMKPGLTCIWQVYGRNQVSFEEWMKMDLQYIDRWSLGLDVKLCLLTFGSVFKGTGM